MYGYESLTIKRAESWRLDAYVLWCSVQSSSVTQLCPDSLQPYELQHARPPCPSPTPRVYSNLCPLSRWCHPTISSSVFPFSSHLQSFPASVFSNESVLHIRWPKYQSFNFSISPSKEYSGLWCWRRLLRVPMTVRRSNQSIQKEISPEYSLDRLVLKLKLQHLVHLMQRADSLEKTPTLGKVEDRRRHNWEN